MPVGHGRALFIKNARRLRETQYVACPRPIALAQITPENLAIEGRFGVGIGVKNM